MCKIRLGCFVYCETMIPEPLSIKLFVRSRNLVICRIDMAILLIEF